MFSQFFANLVKDGKRVMRMRGQKSSQITKQEASQAAKVLGRFRENFREPKVCRECGKVFLALSYQQFCSQRCYQRAYGRTRYWLKKGMEPPPEKRRRTWKTGGERA